MERIPHQPFLLQRIYSTDSKVMIRLCGNCSERCILLDEHNSDINSYLCMICRGFGYQCRNFKYCNNYFNYEDIRSGKNIFPQKIDQYCKSCQNDKCLLDVVGDHPKKARIGLADEYNLCYPCYKSTCEYKAKEVDDLLLKNKKCIRDTNYSYYWRYIINNKNKRTYEYYCKYCFNNCIVLDDNYIFSHKKIIHVNNLKNKYNEEYIFHKCDCVTCLE